MKISSSLLILTIAFSAGISSCIGPGIGVGGGYGGGGYSNGFGGAGYGGGFNTYSTLPSNFIGSAYNHNGRYYSGGNYQTGNYIHQGQNYTNRYAHNGQYYYGGSHQHYDRPQVGGYRTSIGANTSAMQQRSNNSTWEARH